MRAQISGRENERLDALKRYDILDSPREQSYDDLALLASQICGTPIAAISLIDEDRQWFKAVVGLAATQVPLDVAFCAHTILDSRAPLVVEDATLDPRFFDNALVTGVPGVRFYAGTPLVVEDGHSIGALCVIDTKPRQLSTAQVQALQALGRQVVTQLELRRSIALLDQTVSKLTVAERFMNDNSTRLQKLYEATPAMMHSIDTRGHLLSVSDQWLARLGFSREEVVGRSLADFLVPASQRQFHEEHLSAFKRGQDNVYQDYKMVGKNGMVIDVVLSAIAEKDADGRFARGLAVIEDVTARKAAEEALRATEVFLDRAGKIAGVGAWSAGLNTGYIHWSNQTCLIHEVPLGHRPSFEEALSYYSPSSQAVIQDAVRECIENGTPYDLELPMVTAKGRSIWVRAVGEAQTERDVVVGVFGAFQNVTARKLAEAELLEQHELLRVTLDSIGDAVITTDAQGAVQWLNPVAAKLTGWSSTDAPNEPIARVFNIIHQQTRQPVANPATCALDEDRLVSLTDHAILIARDGREYGIETSAAPIRDRTGTALGAVLVFHDVSDRQQAAATIRVANERLELATDAAAIGIWDYDIPANSLRSDEKMCRMYGSNVGSLDTFERWAAHLHPEDSERTQQAVLRALSGDVDYDAEFRILRSNGEIRHVKAAGRVQRDSLGVPTLLVGVNYDITERKQAELELKSTSSLLQTVLDSAIGLSIIATTPDFVVKVFNKGAERMLGYTSDEVVGKMTPLVIHDAAEIEARATELSAALGRPVVGGQLFTEPSTLHVARDWNYIRKDQCRVPVSLVCSPMLGENGELTGYLGIARDITEALDQERSLQDAMGRAEQASAAKTQFLANMSHEIRTPLNAVIGLGYLLEHTPLTEEQRSFLTKIQFAGRSLLSVVNNVLDLSKIEAGEMILEEASFDLVNLTQQIGQMLTPQAHAKGINLVVWSSPELPPLVRGDATRLRQIMTNLLNNAIKFTERGHVDIRLTCVTRDATSIQLRCAVRDTGIGIAPEEMARLFTPFAQADASTTRRFGGTGLGLSIARRFAELMGGEIGVSSNVGIGSEFWVEVPLRMAHASDADCVTGDSKPLRILIIEAPATPQPLATIIRPLGWLSHAVGSADDAVVRLGSGQLGSWPDVIMIDGTVGDAAPAGLMARLRLEFAHLALPPLIILDDELQTYQKQGRAALSAGAILTRPATSSTLFNAVNSVISTRDGDNSSALQATHFDQVVAQWLSGARILVVDDSEVNREVAQRILQMQGAIVKTSTSGAEAVERLRREPDAFDVVLMDVHMPDIDGNEATQIIRQELKLNTLPIIALTAGALVSERDRSLEAGMNDFLSKPFEPAALIRVVRRFVERQRGAPLPVGILDEETQESTVAAGLVSIDSKVAQQMFGDDVALFSLLLSRLLGEFGHYALPLELESLDATARKQLAMSVHKLRGSAGVLGAKAVQRMAGATERALDEGQPTDFVEALLRQLAAAFTALVEEVRPLLDAHAAKNALAAADAASALPATASMMNDLLESLESRNLDALDRFTAMAPSLRAALGNTHFERLRLALEDLDFSLAATALRAGPGPDAPLAELERVHPHTAARSR